MGTHLDMPCEPGQIRDTCLSQRRDAPGTPKEVHINSDKIPFYYRFEEGASKKVECIRITFRVGQVDSVTCSKLDVRSHSAGWGEDEDHD